MRPVIKVLLVLGVVLLAVGVVWFAGHKWNGKPDAIAKGPSVERPAGEQPGYNDPLSMVQRWRRQLAGPEGQGPSPTDTHGRPPVDLHSSSQNEGTIGARRSDEPVAGADPPGPTLRPTGIDGEVVTGSWRPRDPSAGNSYTIAAGDTLYGIAVKFYGDPRYASNIEAANPGVNPRALRVGDRLVLPEKTPEARPGETPAPAPQGKVYVVQKNDTLIGISRRIYGDAAMYRKIYEANKDVLASPNAALHIGQKLRLPEP